MSRNGPATRGLAPCFLISLRTGKSSWLIGFYKLNVERDGDLISHQDASGLERRVPGQAKVFAVDLGRGRQPNALVAPRILRRFTRAFHSKGCRTGNPMNRKFSRDRQFLASFPGHLGRAEQESRKL